jgi:uncharacterized Fe-S cluster protein YjdI
MGKIREYEGQDLTVAWDAGRCIHAAECVHGLPAVFDSKARPWIVPDRAGAEAVREVVARCPTGALYIPGESGPGHLETVPADAPARIEVSSEGPLYVQGRVTVVDHEGNEVIRDTRLALCRCGASARKPFCDGTHSEIGFPGDAE